MARRRARMRGGRCCGPSGRSCRPPSGPRVEQDDHLVLLFMCCLPRSTPASAIALTLRAVGGLTTAEIAKAFLVPRRRWPSGFSRGQAEHPGPRRCRSACRPKAGARRAAACRAALLYLIFSEGTPAAAGRSCIAPSCGARAIRVDSDPAGPASEGWEVAGAAGPHVGSPTPAVPPGPERAGS